MAEPTVKINLANPTEVARETLRRLALRRIAPTPDNYQTLYEEIAGAPAMAATTAIAATAASALSGLVMDLSLHHPELAGPVEILDRAIRKGDWAQCRKQLSQITLQLKQRTDGSGSEEDLTLLRDLLAKTLEFGVIPQLSHHPALADRAQQLASAVRDAGSASALRNTAASLKSLWIDVDQHASHLHDQQETFRRILLLLVENIGELLDDDTWLRGQLDMVQEIVAGIALRHDEMRGQDPVAAGSGKTAQGSDL